MKRKTPSTIFWTLEYRTVRFLLLIFLIFPTCFTACAGGAKSEFPALRVGWSDWTGDYVFVLAQQLGLYEKYGVGVDLVYLPSYQQVLSQFGANVVDTGNIAMGDVLLLSQYADIKVVSALDSSEGADAVVATKIIKSPADLKGMRYGVQIGSVMGELFLQEMLKKYSLTVDDVILVDVPPEAVPGNMGYYIDAGHTWTPFDQRAVALGYHVIFTSEETPTLFPDLLPFKASLAGARSADVRAFVAALLEASDYWRKNPAQGSTLVAEYISETVAPVTTDEISLEGVKLFSLQDNAELFQPGTDTNSLFYTAQLTLDYMIRSGSLTRLPDLTQLFDPSYLGAEVEE